MVVGVGDGWMVGFGDMGRVVVGTGGITGGAVLEEIGTVEDGIVMVGPSVSSPNVEISTYVTIDPTKTPTMMSSNNIQHRLL